MPRIPTDELERLKREVDLVELVRGRGVELKARGRDWVGRCPFHEEEEGSFVVTPAKGLFHCFGCGASGDAIAFVMRLEGVTFRHAVELLREGLPPLAAGGPPAPVKRSTVVKLPAVDLGESLEEVLNQTSLFYHQTLLADQTALDYLERRGIRDDEAVKRFRIGYSNRTLGYRLPKANRRNGADIRGRLQDVGLLRESGHEHLAGSVVWPFFDEHGHVVGMYGRKVGSSLRPGTPLHLYLPGPHRGLFNWDALRESREVILTESVIDAMTFWVSGFRHVTSAFGAAGLTEEMMEAFRAYGTERVLVAFDRDQAGDDGAALVAKRLSPHGVGCFRVLFPRGMDANEYALKVTPAARSLGLLLAKAEWMAGPTGRRPVAVACAPLADPTRAEPEPPLSPQPPQLPAEELPLVAAAVAAAAAEPPSPRPATPFTASPFAGTPSPVARIAARAAAASPAPSPPRAAVDAEVNGDEVVIRLGDRRWRVRGLGKNLSYEQLRVNLLVARDGETPAFHVDTFDLYAARRRVSFVKQAAEELEVKESVVKADLAKVLLKLEELQDEQIQAALAPKPDPVASMSAPDRDQALALLKNPRLLDRILEDFSTCGLVGEETNKLVGYLAAVSRKLERPLAVLIQSSSAAGKSALMEAVLAFVPEEQKVQYSAMTGQSLFYMGASDLKHKLLAIAEEEGAQRASYALKLLQSEGRLSIASTGKDPHSGRLVTHEYRVEGPVGIMLTTTAIDLDEELMSRCLVLSVDEDREQTRAIHRLQREAETLEGLRQRRRRAKLAALHQNAQRLLRPLSVVNRYARQLTFLDVSTRTRRDHEKYLALIRAVALLHQHQREVRLEEVEGRQEECVVVTLEDIEVANRLAAEVLGRTLDELAPQTRRFLEMLHAMVSERCAALAMEQDAFRFNRTEARQHTGWSYPQVRRHLDRLVEMEYVLVHRGGRGQSFVYELLWDGKGRGGETFLVGLVDVEALRVKAEGTTTALTPSEAGFDPPLTPHSPPLDPPLPTHETAAKGNGSGTCEQPAGDEGEERTLGCVEKTGSHAQVDVVAEALADPATDNPQPTTGGEGGSHA